MVREFLSSNSGTRWPFSETVVLDENGRLGTSMFADGAVYRDPDAEVSCVAVSELKVHVQPDGTHVSFTVTMYGADSSSLVKGSSDVNATAAATDGKAYATVSGGWYFFILDIGRVVDAKDYECHGDLVLDPACQCSEPDRVRSISVYNRGDDGAAVPVAVGVEGKVTVIAGHNIYLGTGLPGARYALASDRLQEGSQKRLLCLDAVPGAGLGMVPCVEPPAEDGAGGNLVPDQEGDLVIESDPCFNVAWEHGRIRITGRCRPCCECSDYDASGAVIAEQSRRIVRLASDTESTAAAFNDEVASLKKAGSQEGGGGKCIPPSGFYTKTTVAVSSTLQRFSGVHNRFSPNRGEKIVSVDVVNPTAVWTEARVAVSTFLGAFKRLNAGVWYVEMTKVNNKCTERIWTPLDLDHMVWEGDIYKIHSELKCSDGSYEKDYVSPYDVLPLATVSGEDHSLKFTVFLDPGSAARWTLHWIYYGTVMSEVANVKTMFLGDNPCIPGESSSDIFNIYKETVHDSRDA